MKYFKKISCVLLLVICSTMVMGQKLSGPELIKVFSLPLPKAQLFIEAKNFDYDEVNKNQYQTTYRFSYHRSREDKDIAERFLFFKTAHFGEAQEIEYQMSDKKEYQAFQLFLKNNSYLQEDTYTNDDGQLCNQYSNSKFTFFICSGVDADSKITTYTIRLVLKL